MDGKTFFEECREKRWLWANAPLPKIGSAMWTDADVQWFMLAQMQRSMDESDATLAQARAEEREAQIARCRKWQSALGEDELIPWQVIFISDVELTDSERQRGQKLWNDIRARGGQ